MTCNDLDEMIGFAEVRLKDRSGTFTDGEVVSAINHWSTCDTCLAKFRRLMKSDDNDPLANALLQALVRVQGIRERDEEARKILEQDEQIK